MKLKKYFLFFILFFSCQNNNQDQTSFDIQGEYKFEEKTISINNKESKTVSFIFNINNNFPINNLLDSIFKISVKLKIDTPQAAWNYVVNNTFQTTPFSENDWLHNEFIFKNSATSGLCDDMSVYLAKIWRKLGYEAKVVNLEGHVAAEVYHQGKWKLYDPTLRVFFTNKKNQVASLNELETDSFSINNPSLVFTNLINCNDELNKILKEPYMSSENNVNVSEQSLYGEYNIDSFYTLPSKSSFTIFYDSIVDKNFATVLLSKESKGFLNIPLVPFCVEGVIEYKLGEKTYTLNNDNVYSFLENYAKIEILNIPENSKIHYVVNPYLEIFKQLNNLNYTSTENIYVNTTELETPICVDFLVYWEIDMKLDKLIENELAPYFNVAGNKDFKIDDLEEDFRLYSTYYPNNKTYKDVLDLKNELSLHLNLNKTEFNQLLIDYYPISTFAIYTSLLENNKAYFIEKLNII